MHVTEIGSLATSSTFCLLPPPILHRGNQPQLPFRNRLAAAFIPRQEQQRLLNVWGEILQHHDLRDSPPANVAQSGQVRLVLNVVPPSESATS